MTAAEGRAGLAEIAERAQARNDQRRRAEQLAWLDDRPPGRRDAAGETSTRPAQPTAPGEPAPARRPDGRRRIYEDLPDDYRPGHAKEVHVRRINAEGIATAGPPIFGEPAE